MKLRMGELPNGVIFTPESPWDCYRLGRMSKIIGVSADLTTTRDKEQTKFDAVSVHMKCLMQVLAGL